jgi:hypothetical protein
MRQLMKLLKKPMMPRLLKHCLRISLPMRLQQTLHSQLLQLPLLLLLKMHLPMWLLTIRLS